MSESPFFPPGKFYFTVKTKPKRGLVFVSQYCDFCDVFLNIGYELYPREYFIPTKKKMAKKGVFLSLCNNLYSYPVTVTVLCSYCLEKYLKYYCGIIK